MLRSTRSLAFVLFACGSQLAQAALIFGCSSNDVRDADCSVPGACVRPGPSATGPGPAAQGPEAGPSTGAPDAAPLAFLDAGPEAAVTSDAATESASASPDAASPVLDAAPLDADASSCVPKPGPDSPDDAFEDSNCDGIDGDATRAVFVSRSGSDSAPGTLASPLATLAKAIAAASSAGKDVYVCSGTYPEALQVSGKPVNLFGGYDCAQGWSRTAERAVVAPASGAALTIVSVAQPMRVDRLELRSADAYERGDSSIAAIVLGSPKVRFTHAGFVAGSGADGKAGATVLADPVGAAHGAGGVSLTPVDCVWANPFGMCSEVADGGYTAHPGCSVGGRGGSGGNMRLGVASQPGEAGSPFGAPGGALGFDGVVGAHGQPGAPGAAASAGIGAVSLGYAATNSGGEGKPGSAGQAGGGGSGGTSSCFSGDCFVSGQHYWVGGGGGQGGAGGCGGLGGKGGGGGGASIALLLISSPVALEHCSFSTASGGRGGAPSPGAPGSTGGKRGPGGSGTHVNGVGRSGGDGGNGGPGGPGGPGGGGPSIGVLVRGQAPSVQSAIYHVGIGGKGGLSLAGPDGADGESREIHDLDPDSPGADAGAH
jgi:hypothetical protein